MNSTKEKSVGNVNIIFILFSILLIAAIIFCLLLPHGTFICITVILGVRWIISCIAKLSKGKFNPPFILYPTIMCGLFLFMYMFLIFALSEVIFCNRRPWEYAPEIKKGSCLLRQMMLIWRNIACHMKMF